MNFLKNISLVFFALLMFYSCTDEIIGTEKQQLTFSKDTLTFDTIFTGIGSSTSKILVYNNSNQALNLSQIYLSQGAASVFRINVDGNTSANHSFSSVEIAPHDSMYIFVEVNINPNESNAPLMYEDSILFTTDAGVHKKIVLEAFGRNMKMLKNLHITTDSTLTADKPFLVYGDLVVDSAVTLTIEPGVELYFHDNANLIVRGNLTAIGSFEKQISMKGDRLDKIRYQTPIPYGRVAGQWGGVFLLYHQGKYHLNHVNIYSAYVGIYLSNSSWAVKPHLILENSRIHNMVMYGLAAINSDVDVFNSEISNTGSYTVYLNGGKHQFVQSTIANYYAGNPVEPTTRDKNPAVMLMDLNRNLKMSELFTNCIISGTNADEFSLATQYPDVFEAKISHSFIRKSKASESAIYNQTTWWQSKDSTLFKSVRYDFVKDKYFNFTPDSLSAARGIADKTVAGKYPLDLNGNSRLTDGAPDAGAYEWQPTVK